MVMHSKMQVECWFVNTMIRLSENLESWRYQRVYVFWTSVTVELGILEMMKMKSENNLIVRFHKCVLYVLRLNVPVIKFLVMSGWIHTFVLMVK